MKAAATPRWWLISRSWMWPVKLSVESQSIFFVSGFASLTRHEVVMEELDIVLGRRFSTSTAVTRNTKDGGHGSQVLSNGRQSQLSTSRVASRNTDARRLGNLASLNNLRKTIGPRVIEPVVGGKIDDQALALTQSPHERLANSIGESHDPTVHLAILVHLSHLLGRQALVDNLALGVTLQLLAFELSG